MPIRDPLWDRVLQKQKYFEKILSTDGFMSTWDRYIQQRDQIAIQIWGEVPVWDYLCLGIGLMYNVPPSQLEPLSVFNVMDWPSSSELDEGIWINFTSYDYTTEFPEFSPFIPPDIADIIFRLPELVLEFNFSFTFDFILENFNFSFIFDFFGSLIMKAYFGSGIYGTSVYDPRVFREYIRSTLYKIRQKRTADISFITEASILQEITGLPPLVDELLEHRHELLKSVQNECFLLGLSVLGTSRLIPKENDYTRVTVSDARGNPVKIKVRRLEELMFGLYLGIIPLGFGCIMPRETTFNFKQDKKMPNFFKYVEKKTRTIHRQTTFTAWGYRNYHRVDESTSPHKSERTGQYHVLQEIRGVIENIVENVIPSEEASITKIRQYKNATLQLVSYPAKRHQWGYGIFKAMSEEEFLTYWFTYWESQGLNRNTLNKIYEVIKPCLHPLREEKLQLGKKISETRRNLAKSRQL